jgi:hypothetical protein
MELAVARDGLEAVPQKKEPDIGPAVGEDTVDP